MTAIEHIMKEIETMDQDGIFRSQVDFESGILIIPSPNGRTKLAFWDKKHQIMFIECYGFIPIIMHHSRN
jgi:hypothetical protein